jgi:DNA-binding response OmpR family regulator
MENKIILIEDDEEIREMINDYLSGKFEVTSFNDGMTANQKIPVLQFNTYIHKAVSLHD